MTNTSALVISRMFPSNATMVNGVFQRLATQIEALRRVVDRIDVLFLVENELKFSAADIEAHQARLSRQWSTPIQLTVAPVAGVSRPRLRWLQFGAQMLNVHQQPIARELNNPAALAAVAKALQAAPDLILAHRFPAMCTLLRLKEQVRRYPIFFDLDDVEHLAIARRLIHNPSWPGEQLKLLQIPSLLRAETEAIRLARRTLICSQADLRHLQRFVPAKQLAVVPNSVPVPNLGATDQSEAVVLFVGAMNYAPNAFAADALVRDVWPLIAKQLPNARLVIAGVRPDLVSSSASPPAGVRFAGFVEDLAATYANARVVCCPIRYGGGTRIKIIEAACYGRAVVATPLAAEGLDLLEGTEIIIRRESAQLAQECVRLLNDPQAALRIGTAARERARRVYDRGAVLSQLETLFRSGLAGALQPRA